jgi:hypothetical protein
LPPAVVRLTDLNYLLVEYISNNVFLSFSSATPLFILQSNHSNAPQGLCTTGFGSVLAFRPLCGLGCHYAGICPKLWPPISGPSCSRSTQNSGESAKNNMKRFSRTNRAFGLRCATNVIEPFVRIRSSFRSPSSYRSYTRRLFPHKIVLNFTNERRSDSAEPQYSEPSRKRWTQNGGPGVSLGWKRRIRVARA